MGVCRARYRERNNGRHCGSRAHVGRARKGISKGPHPIGRYTHKIQRGFYQWESAVTPIQIIALVRDGLIVVGIALIFWFVYRGGENSVKVNDLKSLQAQIDRMAKQSDVWRKESTDANAQLSKDVAAINTAPVVVHDWVRNSACTQSAVLPGPAAQASSEPADVRAVQSGTGGVLTGDWRDRAVAEFKNKWEKQLADWRAEDAQWAH